MVSQAAMHHTLVLVMFAFALVTFLSLLFITAPYGRHMREGWGPTIPSRAGWILMEPLAVPLFAWIFYQGPTAASTTALVLLGMWQFHDIHRTFILPFRLSSHGNSLPI